MTGGEASSSINDSAQAPLPHRGRGRDPLRKQWEGEGRAGDSESTAKVWLRHFTEALRAS